jgi:hypothetical protein
LEKLCILSVEVKKHKSETPELTSGCLDFWTSLGGFRVDRS